MSDGVQSDLELLQLTNYMSVVIIGVVGYDYILTLSREVAAFLFVTLYANILIAKMEYIWMKQWTWASTMFFVVRYIGLLWALSSAFTGSSFIPGPLTVSTAILLVTIWIRPIFLAAANLMMILRVYALWNRSKKILSALLFINVAQTVIAIVVAGIYANPNTNLSDTLVHIQDFTFCTYVLDIPWGIYSYSLTVPRSVLGILLLVLALFRTLKVSIDLYKETRQWRPNRYMKLFVQDGFIYFAANKFYIILTFVRGEMTVNSTVMPVLHMLSVVTICTMMPRFIISVREMYYQDSHLGSYGIDSGFGIASQSVTLADIASDSVIAFAVRGQDEIMDENAANLEAIQLRLIADHTHRV